MKKKNHIIKMYTEGFYERELSEEEIELIKDYLEHEGINPKTATERNIAWAFDSLCFSGDIERYRDNLCIESCQDEYEIRYEGDTFKEE